MTIPEARQQLYRDATNNVRRAIARALVAEPFYGCLALHLQTLATGKVPTMAADGVHLMYNPHWAAEAAPEQIRICILRLVTALALRHHVRRQEREESRWQLASLIVCLATMHHHGAIPAPELFFSPRLWDTWVERAYEMLPDPPPPPDNGIMRADRNDDAGRGGPAGSPGNNGTGTDAGLPGAGPGTGGMPNGPSHADHGRLIDAAAYGYILDAPLPEHATAAARERAYAEQQVKWMDAAEQSLHVMKSQGHDPGSFVDFVHARRQSRIDWRELLRDFIRETTQDETSWSYPNRRFVASGLYLPGKDPTGCPPIYFAVDTSGSVSDDELAMVWTEIRAAAAAVTPEYLRVIQCDAAVQDDQTYEPDHVPEIVMVHGRGGTAYRPVFDLVDRESPPPACLIYLTDLYCNDYRSRPPDYPVLWIATPESSPMNPPWGERVNLTRNTGPAAP